MVRHKMSGRYYARLYSNGKEKWQSLKTTHFSVAEAKLAGLQKEHRQSRGKEFKPGSAKMTFAQAAELHMTAMDQDATLKRRTLKYFKEIRAAVLKSWNRHSDTEIRRLTPVHCREWAVRFAKEFSATRFNASLSFVKRVFDIAIENAVIYSNPAKDLKRMAVRSKKLALPTLAKFAEFIAEMRRGRSRDSKNCADLAEGLAYTGMRIGEAGEVCLADINFRTEELKVAGDPEEGTKNSEIRLVPLIPQAHSLFTRMLAERTNQTPTERLFKVRECQKSMDRAAKKVGMARITHHDLRHFFATVCIESGVDIPTVSRWLGHKDGGALAMKTYGHLRREHSAAQAKKVTFTPGIG
jgi:integrase